MSDAPASSFLIVAGAFLALAGFGTLLAVELRDRAFAFYAAVALAFAGKCVAEAVPTLPHAAAWHAGLTLLEIAGVAAFALAFFEAASVPPLVRRLVVALAACDVVAHLVTWIGGVPAAGVLGRYLFVGGIVFFTNAIVRSRAVAAREAVLGFLTGAAGTALADLAERRVIAAAWDPVGHGIIAVAMILLAAGLAARLRNSERAARRYEQLARIDGLTGVNNRMALDARLTDEWDRARRGDTSLAALMVDVDYFKRYNDTYGHQAGDDVLRAVAATVAGAANRRGDFTGRYGGEEFVVVLPATDAHGAREIAERIRSAVSALDVPHDGVDHEHVTVSVGAAAVRPAAGGTPTDLVARADAAMYAAKQSGRDRVAVDDFTDKPTVAGVP